MFLRYTGHKLKDDSVSSGKHPLKRQWSKVFDLLAMTGFTVLGRHYKWICNQGGTGNRNSCNGFGPWYGITTVMFAVSGGSDNIGNPLVPISAEDLRQWYGVFYFIIDHFENLFD